MRGVNDLSNGHLGAASSSNLLLVVAIPFALYFLARWTWVSWQGSGATVVPALPRSVKIGLGALVLVFWVARNLPGSWLAP